MLGRGRKKMESIRNVKLLILICFVSQVISIPSSMVEDIKARELRSNKAKRIPLPAEAPGENLKIDDHYYGNPTAIKRGTGLSEGAVGVDENSNDGDWASDDQNGYQNMNSDFQPQLYNDDNVETRKNIEDYGKGFGYDTNRENLDEALENAVLKSELYGYMNNDNKKRRKRDSRKFSFRNQAALDDLTPEEVLDLLALYENEHRKTAEEIGNFEQDNSVWLDVPVRHRPEVSDLPNLSAAGYMDQNPSTLDKNRWMDYSNKHFMARKRNDPTKELRYLTGPSRHDYYSLSQLLNNRREPNVPVFHRYVL